MPDKSTAGLIPDQLLANLKKGDCVLFLGADLPLGYAGAPLSRPELAAALAEKFALPRGLTWPKTVDEYLAKYTKDLNGLISFIMQHNSGPKVRPGPLHQAIARAGFRGIVSAWYDETLEQALGEAGYRVNRVVRDVQTPYIQEGEREVFVVNLYGSLTDLESLALNSWQHSNLLVGQLSRKLQLVTAFATLRPPLFINFDLADDLPMNLYGLVSANITEHMKRAYAVYADGHERFAARWLDMNVELRQADAATFLTALAAQLPAASLAGKTAIHVHKPPYKFLDYYQPADADLFCGRDNESQIVTRLALSGRLLTLFGPSGAGKTSLLLAGVVPRLAAEGYSHLYVRALDDPLLALRHALVERLGCAERPELDLRAFLEASLGEKDRLLVIFDQFEELFLRVGSKTRRAFFAQLAALFASPTREVRFIFSLREDYLARLDEARPNLPDILAASFRLPELDRNHARVAITEPAARASVTVEPALVEALVGPPLPPGEGSRDRRTGQAGCDLLDSDGRVSPPALQIVLNHLYRAALPLGHDPQAAPPAGLTLTLTVYQSVTCCVGEGEAQQELRGSKAILARYVEEGLAELPGLLQSNRKTSLGAETGLGRALLKVLVTSRSTKAALTHAEMLSLLDEAGEISASDEADRRRLQAARLGLEQVRLLRSFERGGQGYYELAHDHLALAVAALLSEQELQVKVARELLRRALDNWRSAQLLIPLEALKLIDEQRQALRRLNADELELLLRSSLALGYETAYWFERAAAGGVKVDDLVLEGLKAESFKTRAAAVQALGQLAQTSEVCKTSEVLSAFTQTLADPYPQVRLATIQALEALQPTGEWRTHLKYECYVPAGEFIMGDKMGHRNEKTAHMVYLPAFYIARYPVTNADYLRYKQDTGQPFTIPPSKEDHPVTEVNWYDAREYAAWAGMRLLSEAQWEKAASWEPFNSEQLSSEQVSVLREWESVVGIQAASGKKRDYPWGDTFDKNKCNTSESDIKGTTPVGRYSPQGDSPYGVADMAGNVWEWTSSLNGGYPYRADDGRENLTASGKRVLRGGGWYNDLVIARCACRSDLHPDGRNIHYGFRLGCLPSMDS